jgi:hypothetical protein
VKERYPGILLEGLRKTTNNLRIAGLQADIRTWDFPNMKKCKPLDDEVL